MNYHTDYASRLEMIFKDQFNLPIEDLEGLVRDGDLTKKPVFTTIKLLKHYCMKMHEDSPQVHKLDTFMLEYSPLMDQTMYELGEAKVQKLIKDVEKFFE